MVKTGNIFIYSLFLGDFPSLTSLLISDNAIESVSYFDVYIELCM